MRYLGGQQRVKPLRLHRDQQSQRRVQIAVVQRRSSDGARLLLSAARRLEPLDAGLARETHLEALAAAMWAGDLDRPGGVRAYLHPDALAAGFRTAVLISAALCAAGGLLAAFTIANPPRVPRPAGVPAPEECLHCGLEAPPLTTSATTS